MHAACQGFQTSAFDIRATPGSEVTGAVKLDAASRGRLPALRRRATAGIGRADHRSLVSPHVHIACRWPHTGVPEALVTNARLDSIAALAGVDACRAAVGHLRKAAAVELPVLGAPTTQHILRHAWRLHCESDAFLLHRISCTLGGEAEHICSSAIDVEGGMSRTDVLVGCCGLALRGLRVHKDGLVALRSPNEDNRRGDVRGDQVRTD
mmetsp:Transcript_25464/g.53185  ORF Transcript_25464/g.53185 Transcript_25464/m.53185 type:complete len:209 (+) Transcript_25464:2-628(+)